MLQNREQFNLEKLVSWSSYRKWADSIIAMSEEPPDDMTKASRRDDSRSERFRALLMMGFSLVVFVVTQAQQPSIKENLQQPTAATLAHVAQQKAGLRRIQPFRLTETIKTD